jgi:hypothetical protein
MTAEFFDKVKFLRKHLQEKIFTNIMEDAINFIIIDCAINGDSFILKKTGIYINGVRCLRTEKEFIKKIDIYLTEYCKKN